MGELWLVKWWIDKKALHLKFYIFCHSGLQLIYVDWKDFVNNFLWLFISDLRQGQQAISRNGCCQSRIIDMRLSSVSGFIRYRFLLDQCPSFRMTDLISKRLISNLIEVSAVSGHGLTSNWIWIHQRPDSFSLVIGSWFISDQMWLPDLALSDMAFSVTRYGFTHDWIWFH